MRWRRLGWLVCAVTAALFGSMALVEAPAISAKLGGLPLPDTVLSGNDEEAARALYSAFQADFMRAGAAGRHSASAAYAAMHAGSDLVFPPLQAASLAFLAFASVYSGRSHAAPSRAVRIGIGLVLALALAYLACDLGENAVADSIYGPEAMTTGFDASLVPALQLLTRGKYLTLAAAAIVIIALWAARWKRPRRPDASVVRRDRAQR